MLQHLNYNREEVCLKLLSNFNEDSLLSGYKLQYFQATTTTTVYFGASSEQWEGTKILSYLGLGIKVRFYEFTPRLNLFLIDSATQCVIELKTMAESYGMNSKVKAGEKTTITYGEFLNYISDLSETNILNRPHFKPISKTLMEFIKAHALTSIVPAGATSYQRKHFVASDHRISLDQNISYYLTVKHDKDIIFSKALDCIGSILEIKKNRNLDIDKLPIIKALRYQNIPYEFFKKSKGMQLDDIIRQESHEFIEPELDERADNDWVITEREIKLDALSDPRLVSKTVQMGNNVTIFNGTGIININYQRIYDVGSSGIVYMSADLQGTDPMLKYKFFVTNDDQGALVRREVVIPYTPEALQDVANELEPGINIDDVIVTPYFCRDRIKCNVYMADTRNVFEIYGDHSTFVKGECNKFNQVEIEYAGIICKQGTSIFKQQKLEDVINNDFMKLRAIVLDKYNEAGNPLTASTRTKYDWAKKEVFDK